MFHLSSSSCFIGNCILFSSCRPLLDQLKVRGTEWRSTMSTPPSTLLPHTNPRPLRARQVNSHPIFFFEISGCLSCVLSLIALHLFLPTIFHPISVHKWRRWPSIRPRFRPQLWRWQKEVCELWHGAGEISRNDNLYLLPAAGHERSHLQSGDLRLADVLTLHLLRVSVSSLMDRDLLTCTIHLVIWCFCAKWLIRSLHNHQLCGLWMAALPTELQLQDKCYYAQT